MLRLRQRCGFCEGSTLQLAFTRSGRRYLACRNCQAYLQDVASDIRGYVSDDAYEEGEFASRIEQAIGHTPDVNKLREFQAYLRAGKLLEVGPGTGHFLAAAREAGFEVIGIEVSPALRDYVRRKWEIQTIGTTLEAHPFEPESIDSIVSFNVLEHMVNPLEHLRAAARVLKPGGRYLISTCNADCLVAKVAGPYWSMFKPPDHVSLPSPRSLRMAGTLAELRLLKLWCSEYPLETPVGLVSALRDSWSARRHSRCAEGGSSRRLAGPATVRRSVVNRVLRLRNFGWVAGLASHFMVAGSVKVLYEKPGVPFLT